MVRLHLPINTTDAILDTLGSPTRRQLLERVAQRPQTVGDLARGLPISRPAVSQQLRILERAGLVWLEDVGRSRVVHLRPEGLAPARAWLDQLWPEALDRFATLAEQTWEQP